MLGTLTQIGAKSVHIMPPVVNLGRSASPSARPAAVRYTRVSVRDAVRGLHTTGHVDTGQHCPKLPPMSRYQG